MNGSSGSPFDEQSGSKLVILKEGYPVRFTILDREGLFDRIADAARRRDRFEVNAYVDLLNEQDMAE